MLLQRAVEHGDETYPHFGAGFLGGFNASQLLNDNRAQVLDGKGKPNRDQQTVVEMFFEICIFTERSHEEVLWFFKNLTATQYKFIMKRTLLMIPFPMQCIIVKATVCITV